MIEPTDPAGQTRPPPWMTARSIAAGIASTRSLVMYLAGDPDRPFLDKIEQGEERLVQVARAAGIVLGPIQPR